MHRILPLVALALMACGDKDDTASDFDFTTFEGGTFQFTTTAVSDGCYDGSFEPIFMPDGADTPNDWAATTELPSWADLPSSYELALPAPFLAMDVTVEEGGDALMVLAPTDQPDAVALDADNFPNCMVQITISADLTITGADTITGSATLETAGFEADPANCPVVQSDPCEISLDITAARD
jgi:hypothetical protein